MAPLNRAAAIQKEGRLELALRDYTQGKFKSLSAAAKAYNITRSTLQRRLAGIPSRLDSDSNARLLSPTEENSLEQWILSMDQRGMPPRLALVKDMAGLLLAQRSPSDTVRPVGQCWISRFIARHDTLKKKYNRKFDYQRALCEEPKLIRSWFERLQAVIEKYGIHEDDIFNFDETGFQMGILSTAKVVTGSDRVGKPFSIQPGNREWVTLIECICTRGIAIPPIVIFQAALHQRTWYENGLLPQDWSIAVSENGWTTNSIALHWLEHVFDKHTKRQSVGQYRLLLLDGHGSHVSAAFDQYCSNNSIIALCMPPHSSHLLQPLDVCCFSVLKRSYGRLVEEAMSRGVNHIDKLEFLSLYQYARAEALHERNIKSSFLAAGISPYNPQRVLSLLHTQYRTPSPTLPQEPLPAWTAETPHNIVDLEQQTKLVKSYLQRRTHGPSSPIELAIDQLIKGAQNAMNTVVLLTHSNEKLFQESHRQKRKRNQRRSYIANRGILSGSDAQQLIQQAQYDDNRPIEAAEDTPSVQQKRAPRKCSVCSSLEHTARTCAQR
jgi:hypothetical protein